MGLTSSGEKNLRKTLQDKEDELRKTEDALCKALWELDILINYVPEKTSTIATRVITDIRQNIPNSYWEKYQYCLKCDKVHGKNKCGK